MAAEKGTLDVKVIEIHEDFMEHIEAGQSKIKILSVIAIVVSFLLIASYFSQLVIPFTSGTRFVQVDLLDPWLRTTQVFLIILTGVWLYNGVADLLFARGLGKSIKEVRRMEKELEAKYLTK